MRLRVALANRVVRVVGFMLGFALTLLAGVALFPEAFDGITDMGPPSDKPPASVKDHPVTDPAQVLRLGAKHGCWGDERPRPEGAIAGHAVVTYPGEAEAKYVPADVGFAMWLGPDRKERTGDEAPGTPHLFCP